MAVMAVAAPAGTILVSLVSESIFVPRTLLASLPYLFLAVGGLLVAIPRRLAVVAGVAAALGLMIGSARMLDPALQRPQWDSVAERIDKTRQADEPVLELFPFSIELIDPYLDPPYTVFRAICNGPSTAPGQVLLKQVRCRDPQGVAQALARARRRRLFVITPGRGRSLSNR